MRRDVVFAACVAAALLAAGAIESAGAAAPAGAVEIQPHRAIYTMTLGRSSYNSGVVDAQGAMAYQWGETCDGWTIEQRYRLRLSYTDSADVIIDSDFVTWESKDGLRYRFNQTEKRNGTVDQEIRGVARLDGPGEGGTATFTKPKRQVLALAPGVLFPTAHTLFLIHRAEAGAHFIARHVFDGATTDNAVLVSAVISDMLPPYPATARISPVLQHRGWRVRLAFFPADTSSETPDYELGMRLLDNGISENMVIDYGDYSIHAKLDDVQPLPKPRC